MVTNTAMAFFNGRFNLFTATSPRIRVFDADIGFCNLLLLMEDLVFGIVLRTGNSC